MDTIFLGNDDQKNLVGSKLTKFCSLCREGKVIWTESSSFDVPAGEPVTLAVGEGESVRLKCRVEAHPIDQLRFTWFFNNTLDTTEVEESRVSVEGDHSILDYTPKSARDYGTLSCWATNVVGTQAEPCRFTVNEAGNP